MNQRGYFAVGIYGGKTPSNTGMLWRSAQSLGASFIFTVGCRYLKYDRTDTTKAAMHIPASLPPPIAERACALAIEAFRALDCAGPAWPLVTSSSTRYCLNVAVAGSIVMFDRVKA